MSRNIKRQNNHKNSFFKKIKIEFFNFYHKINEFIKELWKKIKVNLVKISQFLSRKFENIFNENKFSSIAALFLSLIAALSMYSSGMVNITKQISYIIKDKELIVQYDKEKYIVDDIPQTVNIALSGDDASIQAAKNNKNMKVVLNLNNLTIGKHNVKLNVENINSNVQAYPIPTNVEVNIQNRDFKVFPIFSEVINSNILDNAVIQSSALNNNEVTLSGTAQELSKVSFVRALIDARYIKQNINNNNNIIYEGSAPVLAYDEKGNKLEKVICTTEGIGYKAEIKPISKKIINDIRIQIKGKAPNGQAVNNITLKEELITACGKQEDLDKLTFFNICVDLSKLSEKGTVEGIIEAPENVSIVNYAPKKIQATVNFAPEESKKINLQCLNILNSNNDLYSYEIQNNNKFIEIEIFGTKEQLAKVPELIQKNEIKLVADVVGLKEGTHESQIKVISPSYYRYALSQNSVKIKINKKS